MQLLWFRNDLRLDDNPALFYACQAARESSTQVCAVYIACPSQWREHNESARKLGLIQEALNTLRQRLAKLGIPLRIAQVEYFTDIPQLLSQLCIELKVQRLHFNGEVALNEQRRDVMVRATLQEQGVDCSNYSDDRIVPERLLSKQGAIYKVFTPWYKAWLARLKENLPAALPCPEPVAPEVACGETISLPGAEIFRDDLWLSDEAQLHALLEKFCSHKAAAYEAQRDFPATPGTSTLSPYLATGQLSARRCMHVLLGSCAAQGLHYSEALEHVWLRELAWRDFYRYLMASFEHLSRGENFKPDPLPRGWLQNQAAKEAWEQGQTGFPIIDAAMRQLVKTGWMHNRLRMLVASFYCKLLCLDWRDGEAFFMGHLVDGDFASNNGGWQWSSSTGCDASPWFRIFNPLTQSQKFDNEGTFIKRFVPELAHLDSKSIHCPSSEQRQAAGYPEPIIDYKIARQAALDFFKV